MHHSLRAVRFLAAIALALTSSRPVHAANSDPPDDRHSVSVWTVGNGLPQGTINDLLQTEDGALWIATFGGLLRFDGVEFRTFDFDTLPSLPSVRITSLEHDGPNGLWALTQHGHVLRIRHGKIFQSLAVANPMDDMLSLISATQAGSTRLWLRGSSGSTWLYEDGAWSKPFGELPKKAVMFATSLDADGRMEFATEDKLLRIDGPPSSRTERTAPARITALSAGSKHSLWVGLVDGLAMVRGDAVERVRVVPPLETRVSALSDDGQGGVWIGTDRGVTHLRRDVEADEWIRDVEPMLLETFQVHSLLLDKEGNLWVGSRGKGLARISPRRVEVFRPHLLEASVAAVESDGTGGAWVSFANRDKAHATAATIRGDARVVTWTIEKSLPVFALLHGSDGHLWSGFETKLVRDVNGTDVEIELPPRLGPIIETKRGEIWVAVQSGRRVVRIPRKDQPSAGFDFDGRVISMSPDCVDGFWIGGVNQVLRYSGGRTETFGSEHGLPQGDVRSILSEPDGSAWIASYGGGLAYLKNGHATRISRSHGLPDMSLSNIQDDGAGRLWLLSNQGLIVASREELKALVEGRESRIDPVVIGPAAGMPEGNFGTPAGVMDSGGRLWFGTIEGPVRVDPREFPFNRTPPRVHIESVLADDVELGVHAPVRVPPATRRLVIEFTTFALTAPDRVHFRYRLDGFDDDWNDGGSERSASYTGLKPRQYTFRVKARNEDGVWSHVPEVLSIEVAPSWWETNWFMTALAFLAIGSLYLLDRVRLRIIQRRATALLEATEGRARAEERESRLREELAHIGRVATAGELATSLAHEVNQPLAAIVHNAQAGRHYLAKEAVDKTGLDQILRDIAQQGQRASDIIHRLREFLRKKESERRPVDLNQVVRDTLPLVRRELHDHSIDLRLELAPASTVIEADPIQLQQVVVNLVKNACEAMSASKGLRTLELRTKSGAESVGLEVRDTGPGIAPEIAERLFQPYTTTKSTGMGLGLAICRSIVEAHGGRIGANSANGRGTTFQVDLPRRAE